MKIRADIPVQRIDVPGGATWRNETMTCTVARVLRWRCDRHRARFHYVADVLRPARTAAAYACPAGDRDTVRVLIVRKLNPRWKPPAFEPGRNELVLCEVPRRGEDAPRERDPRTLDLFSATAAVAAQPQG